MSARRALDLASRRGIGWAALAASIAAISSILLLGISGWFLTAAAMAGTAGVTAAFAFNYLIPSAAIRFFALLRTGSRYGERLLSHRAALLAMADLRRDMFGKLAAQDSRTGDPMSSGAASARLMGDIDSLEDMVIRQPARLAALIASATSVLLVAIAGWQAALVLVLMLAILPLALRWLAHRLTDEPARDAAQALGDLRAQMVEYAAARPEIAAYGLADRVTDRLGGPTAALDAARARLFIGEGVIAALMLLYAGAAVAMVLRMATGPAPYVALAVLAAAAAVEAMTGLSRTALKRASIEQGLKRLETLDSLPGLPAPRPFHVMPPATVRIGGALLPPGARIAILGGSGSGKTILLESLAGIRVSALDMAVNGLAPARCHAELLRAQFALAAQDAPMLAGTIADNLRLARPGVTEQDMAWALHIACLDKRIAATDAGLDTPLGEEGGTLSGGERKRLSLARAILAQRPWLLLDEPTEGLDAQTEALLVDRLDRWLDETRTGLILVSHRRQPLRLAEQRMAIADIDRHAQGGPVSQPARSAPSEANAQAHADDQRVEVDANILRTDRRGLQPGGRIDLDIFGVQIEENAGREVDVDPGLGRPAETV